MTEKKGVLAGFKEFLMRGNVIELAVAVVVGAAFTNIVNAVVKGLINPLIGAIGTTNLDDYSFCLGDCRENSAGEVIKGVHVMWGSVVTAALTFLITAAVVYFLMILPMNKWKERQEAKKGLVPPPLAPTEVELLAEIRDLLLAQREEGRTAADPRGFREEESTGPLSKRQAAVGGQPRGH
ncbi:large conductance mechanosensitive channel protein MscL [Streptomyces sp. NPDC059740]|uniref:large conductance mechanosensitive channel protein MscL n=1 Tax=Streptomyces sp. NPDC059740 TaxID=3346926 RepID=UPI0036540BD3